MIYLFALLWWLGGINAVVLLDPDGEDGRMADLFVILAWPFLVIWMLALTLLKRRPHA